MENVKSLEEMGYSLSISSKYHKKPKKEVRKLELEDYLDRGSYDFGGNTPSLNDMKLMFAKGDDIESEPFGFEDIEFPHCGNKLEASKLQFLDMLMEG